MRKSLNLIVALSEDNVIGDGNRMPWNIPDDLRRFKKLTSGHAIIMGRKTHTSIGVPLPNRTNIVLTRTPKFFAGCINVSNPDVALEAAYLVDVQPFVIGGAEIYHLFWPRITRVYMTRIHKLYPYASTRFEPPDLTRWELTEQEMHPGFTFQIYERERGTHVE